MNNPKLLDWFVNSGLYGSEVTLRDLFAGLAMAGYLANERSWSSDSLIGKYSYRAADAMLAEREELVKQQEAGG